MSRRTALIKESHWAVISQWKYWHSFWIFHVEFQDFVSRVFFPWFDGRDIIEQMEHVEAGSVHSA